ncbi:DUF1194 domain-containing protein [Couchioplanes azureus]|uniref:DUF1194 domain-containing protein n=1 Tax=Couchioplanes caeruleus TaxID=56438 RepID=UPI00166F753E|nr:DUF1194 domain-containing protein [Couchioplanes caeruleus]
MAPFVAATPATAADASRKRDLVLLLDGSGSIDASDWALQLEGYSAALQDPVNFPLNGTRAVGVVQWSYTGVSQPATRTEIPLTQLNSAADLAEVVAKVKAIRQIGYSTNPGDALRAGTNELLSAGRVDADWNLCMSTDGSHNSGEYMSSAWQYARDSGVDRYNVVAIEDGGFRSAEAVRAYGPYVFGGGTVTVARTTAEFTSLLSGCVADPLQLDALEVTQSVQDLDNSVPLVAYKPTVVRAYLSTPGDPVRTSGRLRGFAGGRELPGSPLTAVNAAPGVLVDGNLGDDRDALERTLNFAVPLSWTAKGQTEFALELPGGVSCPGAVSGPTMLCSKVLTFGSGFAADVEFRGVSWQEGGQRIEPSLTDLVEQSERTWSQLPTAGWHAGFATLHVDKRPTIDDVNEALAVHRRISREFGDKRWYGVLHGSSSRSNVGGKAMGAVASGWDENATGATDADYGRNRVVHELGHTYGLHHSVNAAENGYKEWMGFWDYAKNGWCGEEADDDTPDYADKTTIGGRPVAALGPMGDRRREIWGMDPRFLTTNEAAAVSSPETTTSLMSYCRDGVTSTQRRWIGQRDYRQLFSGDRDPIDGFDAAPLPVGSGLTLRGIIAADGASAQLKPALAVDLAPTPSDPDGSHELVLQDAAGTVLHSVRFTPGHQDADAGPDGADAGPQASLFNVVVPADLATVARVQLRADDRILATATATTAAPTVSVGVPASGSTERLTISWSSRDADSPALANTVLYSADGGTTWQVVAVDITGSSVSVPRWSLPGSTTAKLKVIASDGVRSTAAASETFSLPDLAPTVEVLTPGAGQLFTGAQAIPFAAQANDVEDGRLDGTAVRWSSDRNGLLGTGAQLPWRADKLSEGEHVITVTARDSAGQTSTATVRITVLRVAPPPKAVDLAPTVNMLAPGAGQTFSGAQVIPFAAQANDVEDGLLDGAAVQWSSDRDGPLGTGAQLPLRADQLSLGEHVITVTARDSAGQTSTATVRITVVSAYTFGGFESPVVTPGPTSVKAGSTIPLKWSISGPGVHSGTIKSARFLSDGASYKMVESGPHWHLNVQTPKTWAATSQVFRITLVDGSTYEAEFILK